MMRMRHESANEEEEEEEEECARTGVRGGDVLGDLTARTARLCELTQLLLQHALELHTAHSEQ